MAVELFRNLLSTTLASGYTAASGSIEVDDATGFPSTGTFRVALGNSARTIFRVDSVSGTTFTGAAEEFDGNANSGDSVTHVATRGAVERMLQSPDAGGIDAFSGISGADVYGPIWKLGRPDLVSWAWQNQGSATVVDANGMSFLSAVAAGRSIHSRLISAPGTPYTITVLLRAMYPGNTNVLFTGLVLRESSTSKLHTFCFAADGNMRVRDYTNDTTFSSDPASVSAGPGVSAGHWHWLRVTDNGTNLIFSWSLDGVNFFEILSQSRTTFMSGGPNEVGIFIDNEGAGGSFVRSSFLSWVVS